MSRVTVVIPTYNCATFIAETIASVQQQTLPPAEIVVVDDRSTDETRDVVEALGERSPVPIRLVVLPRNSGGPAQPMTVGVQEAHTDLVSFVDHDDILAATKLADHVLALDAYPEAVLVFGMLQRLFENGRVEDIQTGTYSAYKRAGVAHPSGDYWILSEEGLFMAAMTAFNHGFGGASGITMRVRGLQSIGGFDTSYRLLWDLDLQLRLVLQHKSVIFIPRLAYFRRVHSRNMSQSDGLRLHSQFMVRLYRRYRDALSIGRSLELQTAVSNHLIAHGYLAQSEGDWARANSVFAYCLVGVGQPYRCVRGLASTFVRRMVSRVRSQR